MLVAWQEIIIVPLISALKEIFTPAFPWQEPLN
jgi:hypothetical protein